ncbi:HlyC/CorC family transporter [Bordetella avium]|uniref:Magnesium and cobalt efflux protein CorC n=1 Tax=Bordetella avium (strain 197N) TaxID=360910 RepID=Q2KWD4_BORA1|nr:transporter associated domain-containing protein [Bordetella avium]RIQ48006.1 CBS domain-containing protein [Bordetella avium]RIQ66495.1 CBS domain-containing protein [Bordetella avium]RIQ70556.1 CBS domain-containing protein [Bordetella avium]CAJ48449.1 magnesium and cobalt efflux protein [Bordetella avium 197N]
MSDPYPAADSATPANKSSKSLLDRVLSLVRREPEDREGIKTFLEAAHGRTLLDAESYAMIKGALAVSERTAADIMVPRSKMDLLDVSQPLQQLLATIIETAHSRFPVYENDRDNILGILLAKDLLRYMLDPSIELRALIRPAIFIPESKRLNVLLREFREARNHLAIVIDEHGGISGLVTMEDVLEQIVGEIEDEFDEDEEESIFPEGENQWRLLAATEISHFNDTFGTHLPDDEYDSVGGWLGGKLGRIPRRGDTADFEDFSFEVIRADPRRALWLRVRRVPVRQETEE